MASLVSDVITPVVSLALPSSGLKEQFSVLRCPKAGTCTFSTLAAASDAGAITLNWGAFVQSVISFLIISLCVFSMIKIYTAAMTVDRKRRESIRQVARMCPFCDVEISRKAKRCPHCTSALEEPKKTK